MVYGSLWYSMMAMFSVMVGNLRRLWDSNMVSIFFYNWDYDAVIPVLLLPFILGHGLILHIVRIVINITLYNCLHSYKLINYPTLWDNTPNQLSICT